MILLASIGGIQEFLFDVREDGGGQARSLRHRSFRIQLLAECVAIRLLKAAGLARDKLLFCAAAKVAIDATGITTEARDAVRSAVADLECHLLNETHGRLRLAFAAQDSAETFATTVQRAERALRRSKLRAYAPHGDSNPWNLESLTLDHPWDASTEAEMDAEFGRKLATAKWLSINRDEGELDPLGSPCLGLRVRLSQDVPRNWPSLISCSNLVSPETRPAGIHGSLFHPRTLARHIPRDERGNPIEFVALAQRSRGAPMLGVLKADVDSLGVAASAAIARGGAASLRNFSEGLDRFFSQTLEAEKNRADSPWSNIYTVFSGGDDILAVGPWDLMIDFAGHMQTLFSKQFGTGALNSPSSVPLTLCAAVAIIKPRYPVHIAAHQAEELLSHAKTKCADSAAMPKDQCAAFGDLWKWKDHARIINDGKKLADWVDAGIVQRGWLQTILELALLQCGDAGPEYENIPPATAGYKLAYHIARNWPSSGPARIWIDQVAKKFESQSRHFQTIVRYAMLATRGKNSGEEQ